MTEYDGRKGLWEERVAAMQEPTLDGRATATEIVLAKARAYQESVRDRVNRELSAGPKS